MDFILFAGGINMLLFACAQLLTRKKQPIHYLMALTCLLFSYLLGYSWAFEAGFIDRLPAALVSSDISALFLIAPAFFFTSFSILSGGDPHHRCKARYLAAPALFALGFGFYNAFAAPHNEASLGHFGSPLLACLTTAGSFLMLAAIALDLVAAHRIRAGSLAYRSLFRTQVLFLLAYLAVAIVLLIACLLRDERLLKIATAAFGLIAMGFTLTATSIRYLNPASIVRASGMIQPRPEWDMDSEAFSEKLERLMAKAAPYRDAKLSLEGLARLLGEDPRRLSYHFRKTMATSFRGYLNDLRLRRVCLDLVEKPHATVLDLALDAGFNSKSSFNDLFIKAYGMTPREYRASRRAVAAR
jgi:AraC-like DNA-binding protein